MAPAAEPIHESVAEALLAALAEIDSASTSRADTFWSPKVTAFRCSSYDNGYFASEFPAIIMLRRSAPAIFRDKSSCQWEVEAGWFVLFATACDDAATLPWDHDAGDEGASPETVQERMFSDVCEALSRDLDGYADDVTIDSVEYGMRQAGWTIIEVSLRVLYRVPIAIRGRG